MDTQFPEDVTVVEMFPRDGLQRYDEFVPTEEKIRLIDRLSTTGLREIEVTSFTHPKIVPNLRDAEAVCNGITRSPDVVYRALVPNVVGAERAIYAGVDKINALVTVSPEYNRRNQNMTIEENLEEITRIADRGHDAGLTVEAGIGMSFFSPYEGRIPESDTLSVVEHVIETSDVDEVTLATSMGMANPKQIAKVLETVSRRWPSVEIGLHLHDTNGMSLANTVVALQYGVNRFDSSICGLGGGVILPEALEDIGNTPTEDLVHMLQEMDIETGVDLNAIIDVARSAERALSIESPSHVLKGGTRNQVLSETDY